MTQPEQGAALAAGRGRHARVPGEAAGGRCPRPDRGTTTLQVTDPDGYLVSFWGGKAMTDEELLRWYRLAPRRRSSALQRCRRAG